LSASRLARLLLSSALIALWLSPEARSRTASQVEAQRYTEHIKYLASPELKGRGAGTPGLETAAKYIAAQFANYGLKPAGEGNTYFQQFTVTTGAKPGAGNRLVSHAGGGAQTLELRKDYIPLSFSSNGEAAAGLVFAGYGATAKEFEYDDYAGVDVKDKIVLVLRYEPKSFRKDSKGPEKPYTHHAHLVSKAINARNHGAKAILLVNGATPERDELIKFGSVSGPENAGILIAQVTNAAADRWLRAAGKSLADAQKQIAEKPASFALPDTVRLDLRVDVEREHAKVGNVLGYLPGKTSEYLIIGAHYDHLGLGNESSLAPSQIGQVHPGADDNASGTAGLLELARVFAKQGGELRRGVLFMAFAGEEIGLLGSAEWTNDPTLAIKDAVAMVNMDMIGRVTADKLYIGGSGTGSTFDPLLKKAAALYPFKIEYSPDGYSSSDHTSFAAKGIPVLFFFSGLHGDYHKPSDTSDKINGATAARVVNLVADVSEQLVAADQRPEFRKVQMDPHSGAVPSGGGGYGPYFGSIPDFAPIENGVKFSDVRPGSPADKAGLKGGDILVQFGDKPIKNLYDFTFALRESKVGEVVNVKVLREGKPLEVKVTLEQRR
jgi:aminopeptidase YwaD